ncbi:MAG: hypothetical protein CM1200mP29_06110 [Verrucomicrobiota bacterium]|nr:MAG: hypothetical protein CM1200mP29_06110 [Verrucomicrobiota bacterium]
MFTEADCVVASGNDNSITPFAKDCPCQAPVGYGHRVSFGYVEKQANEIMGRRRLFHMPPTMFRVEPVRLLSPHVIYVEQFGTLKPERFAEMLAEELGGRNEAFRVARSRRKRRRPSRRLGLLQNPRSQ